MRTAAVLLTLCGLAALTGRAADTDTEPPAGAKAELKKLQGTWTVTKRIAGPRELKLSSRMTFTFDGDKLTQTTTLKKPKGNAKAMPERLMKYTVKIDTKTKPHTITLLPENGKAGPVGIYKIEKGELYLALGPPSGVKSVLWIGPPGTSRAKTGSSM